MDQPIVIGDDEAGGFEPGIELTAGGGAAERERGEAAATHPAEDAIEGVARVVEGDDERAAGTKETSEFADGGVEFFRRLEVIEGRVGEDQVETRRAEGGAADVGDEEGEATRRRVAACGGDVSGVDVDADDEAGFGEQVEENPVAAEGFFEDVGLEDGVGSGAVEPTADEVLVQVAFLRGDERVEIPGLRARLVVRPGGAAMGFVGRRVKSWIVYWHFSLDPSAMTQPIPPERVTSDTEAARGKRCLIFAAVGVLLVLAWQVATVHFNYAGNWTALFCTGTQLPVPAELAGGTYVFPGSTGYDGQFYRLVAHDPWFRKPWGASFDDRVWRYRLILVPALAWLMAGGQGEYVEAAYDAVILLSVFAGIYWLGRYALSYGWAGAWGLAFLGLPAVMISVDRMTVDLTLTALCAGFVWYARKDAARPLWAVLAAAALARETGLIFIGASSMDAWGRRRWLRGLAMGAAAIPTLAWYRWITVSMPRGAGAGGGHGIVQPWFFRHPFVGIPLQMMHPLSYPFGPAKQHVIQLFDELALGGMILAVALAFWCLWHWRRSIDAEWWAIGACLVLFALASGPGFWKSAYSYGRPYTPLFFLVGLRVFRGGPRWFVLPAVLVELRVLLQLSPQAMGILSGICRALARL